jgi:NitT/TauT family transport system permease protein
MASTTPHNGFGDGGDPAEPGSPSTSSTNAAAAPSTSRGPAGRLRHARTLWAIAGALTLVVVWQVLSMVVPPVYIASPVETFRALGGMIGGRTLWIQVLITLERLIIGLAAGTALGFVLGVLAGLDSRVRSFFEPIRWVGMTIPVVIIVVLAALWFGLGNLTVILAVALIVIPTIYINTVSGILSVDSRLVEMGRVYHFSRRLMLSEIYVPGIASQVMAGLTLATGVAVRAVVLTEVMTAMSGIGHAFTRAWVNLETAQMFAWVIVVLALMALLEFGLLRPMRRRVRRWRKVAS